jgi:hypothetical protein
VVVGALIGDCTDSLTTPNGQKIERCKLAVGVAPVITGAVTSATIEATDASAVSPSVHNDWILWWVYK